MAAFYGRCKCNSYLAIRDVTNSAYRMVFDTSGDVGIGTTTPDTRLDITTSGVNGLCQTLILLLLRTLLVYSLRQAAVLLEC